MEEILNVNWNKQSLAELEKLLPDKWIAENLLRVSQDGF
jgi:hypothetical protein